MKIIRLPSLPYIIGTIFILFAVGRWGFSQPEYKLFFIQLIPFQLFILSILTLIYQKPLTSRYFKISIFWIIGGWAVEFLGVNTGFPFGPYHYEKALGWGPWGIPALIGLNWWLLLTQVNAFNGFKSFWMRTLFSALVLTFTDWCLEPMAISTDYWEWTTPNSDIPLKNYMGWFVVSWIFSAIYAKTENHHDNVISFPLWLLQVLFFLSFRWA